MKLLYGGLFAAVMTVVSSTLITQCYQLGCRCPTDTSSHIREARQATFDHKTNNGRVFGTLGQNGAGVYGRGGYEHNIFNDHRGSLKGQVHGTRVLGPQGGSSHVGGSLNWQNPNTAASFDVNKQIHGRTSYDVKAGAHWPIGKHADLGAQGYYSKTEGSKSDHGVLGKFKYNF